MEHVKNWYEEKLKKDGYDGPKNVYVATDDVKVLNEIKAK